MGEAGSMHWLVLISLLATACAHLGDQQHLIQWRPDPAQKLPEEAVPVPARAKEYPTAHPIRVSVGCVVNGERHTQGSVWSPHPCIVCACEEGQPICQPIECPEVRCEWASPPAGHCCPVCPPETAAGETQVVNETLASPSRHRDGKRMAGTVRDHGTGSTSQRGKGAGRGDGRKQDLGVRKHKPGGRVRDVGGWKKVAGGGKQEVRGRKQEVGGRKQDVGVRKQEMGGKKQESGGRKQEFGTRKQEVGLRKQESGSRKQEVGVRRLGVHVEDKNVQAKNPMVHGRKQEVDMGVKKQKSGVRKKEVGVKKVGVRKQEAGMRKKEVGVKKEEVGVRKQEAGVRKQRPGMKKQEMSNKKQEDGTKKQVVGTKTQEVGVRKEEVGAKKQEMGAKKPEAAVKKQEAGGKKQVVGVRKKEAGAKKQGVGSRKQEAGTRKPMVQVKKQETDTRKPVTSGPFPSELLPPPGSDSEAPSLPAGCILAESAIACPGNKMVAIPKLMDTGLRTLYLADNDIATVSVSDLSGIQNLQWLDLSRNKVGDEGMDPRAFQNLTQLRRLNLDGNQLSKIPLLPPSLEELKLNDNRLTAIKRHTFRGLSHLLTLDLEGNGLNDGTLHPSAMRPLKQLMYLRLGRNQFRSLPAGLPPSLRELHLESNRIEEVPGGRLNRTTGLNVLVLRSNRIREDRISPRAWFHLLHLETLDLSHNRLVHVPSFLPTGLRQLLLHHNQIERIPAYVFAHLRPGLETLHLSYNHLGADGVHSLSFLGLHDSLQELLLDHNRFQDIPSGILQLRVLAGLRLSDNQIRSVPMDSICDTQSPQDSTLVSVRLENNLIDPRMIPPLAFSCIPSYHSVVLRPQNSEG